MKTSYFVLVLLACTVFAEDVVGDDCSCIFVSHAPDRTLSQIKPSLEIVSKKERPCVKIKKEKISLWRYPRETDEQYRKRLNEYKKSLRNRGIDDKHVISIHVCSPPGYKIERKRSGLWKECLLSFFIYSDSNLKNSKYRWYYSTTLYIKSGEGKAFRNFRLRKIQEGDYLFFRVPYDTGGGGDHVEVSSVYKDELDVLNHKKVYNKRDTTFFQSKWWKENF